MAKPVYLCIRPDRLDEERFPVPAKDQPLLPVMTLLTHQPSQMAIMPALTNRHTPRNSKSVEIDETLPSAEKIRIAPKKTAAKKQEKANRA